MANQVRCDGIWTAEIGHWCLQVDDRFRWQVGNRGGANMFDAGKESGREQRFETIALLLAVRDPGGIGIDEIDGFGRPGRPTRIRSPCHGT